MKRSCQALAILALCSSLQAATHAVLPGEAIQPKIDAAAPGDIIAIFGGTYPGDVTINKAVRLVEVDGQDVTITGNVTWNGVTNAPPFEGFTVGSSGKGITVTNTAGLVIKNVDARGGFGVMTTGNTTLNIVSGQFSSISQDGGELVVSGVQVVGNVSSTINAQKTIVLRAIVGGTITWNSKNVFLGYSTSVFLVVGGTNCRAVIVGSTITGNGSYADTAVLGGTSNSFFVSNSSFKGGVYGSHWIDNRGWTAGGSCLRIDVGNTAVVANSYFQSTNNTTLWSGYDGSFGAGLYSYASQLTAVNNICHGNWRGIAAPYGAIVKNTFAYAVTYPIANGVVAFDTISGDPLFVSGQAPQLQSSSPCVNAGVNDPVFNDLDGSRNDIGPGGGCLFDPQGWTTNKPVVISFDLAPQQLLKGVDTQVTISKGQAVAQP